VLALASSLLACSAEDADTQRWRERATAALARGDRRAAIDAIDALARSAPDAPEAIAEAAALQILAGEAPAAVWRLEAGVTRFPDRDDLRVALGNAALAVSDPNLALRAVAPVGPRSGHHTNALLIRARAALALGDLETALEGFREAAALDPESPARWNQIVALVRDQRLADARAALADARAALPADSRSDLRRVELWLASVEASRPAQRDAGIASLWALVQDAPEDVGGWQAWAGALQNAGRVNEARERLAEAVAAAPDQTALVPLLARTQLAAGDFAGAERTLEQLAARSRSAADFLALAELQNAAGQPERAAETIRRAIEAHPDDALLHRRSAEAFLDRGRTAEARASIARFRALAPHSAQGDFLRARLDLAEGNATAAVTRLQALVVQLDLAATQYWLGRALEASGDLEGAKRHYRLAAARAPRESAPLIALLHLAEQRGDARSAAQSANLLIQWHPGRLEGWIALTRALTSLGDFEAAETVARRTCERFPDRQEPVLALALTLRTRGAHAEALGALDAATARLGASPELAAERAMALGAAGRAPEGLSVAERALIEYPDSASLHHARATLLFALGRAAKGAAAVDRALAIAPDDPTPLASRARFRAATGDLEGARADCERYLRARPEDAEVHFILGSVERDAGRGDIALDHYRRAAALDESAWAPRNNLAMLLAERGDLDGALAAAQEAYALADGDPNATDTLGWLYLQRGLVDRAIALLEDAHAAAPALVEIQLHLALAYGQAGRTDAARHLLRDLEARGAGNAAARGRAAEALRVMEARE